LCFTMQDTFHVWPLYAPIEVVSHTGLAQSIANYFLRLQFPYIFRFLCCSAFISSLQQSNQLVWELQNVDKMCYGHEQSEWIHFNVQVCSTGYNMVIYRVCIYLHPPLYSI
jgi:hypothetical protein